MKVMKSYRLEESDLYSISAISDLLGLSETDVIRLMLYAFERLMVSDCLAYVLDNCEGEDWGRYAGIDGLKRLIDTVATDCGVICVMRDAARDVINPVPGYADMCE